MKPPYYLRSLYVLVLLSVVCYYDSIAQNNALYWVSFHNKDATTYTLTQAQDFLTPKSIARKNQRGAVIDSLDMPVCEAYIDTVVGITNGTLRMSSKWMNGIAISTSDTASMASVRALPFVKETTLISRWNGAWPYSTRNGSAYTPTQLPDTFLAPVAFDESYYNAGWQQIHLCEGAFLHENAWDGQGVTIAVIDAGFDGLYSATALQTIRDEQRIEDAFAFLTRDTHITASGDHGLKVLSILAANTPHVFVGTAPKASYLLYSVDDEATESYIEVYAFVAAMERADSMGADIISSSLGYTTFDEASFDFDTSAMDGLSNPLTAMVNLAVDKGMLVIQSAGNMGNSSWKYLMYPADAQKALTVGSVNNQKMIATSSGIGRAGIDKPDVVAMGVGARAINNNNSVTVVNGTSFATPIISGLAACLWQAHPEWSIAKMLQTIKNSGHLGPNATQDRYGYGVPNFRRAFNEEVTTPEYKELLIEQIKVYPNPCYEALSIQSRFNTPITAIDIYNVWGQKVAALRPQTPHYPIQINTAMLPSGTYYLQVQSKHGSSNATFQKL